MVVLLSLATGLLCDMALGPYAGKETGENALLRTLWDALQPGDILLADRLYCSYCQVALASSGTWIAWCGCTRGVTTDFRRGQCIARRRPGGRVATARAAGVDGRSDLRHDPGDDARAANPRRGP